MMFGKPTDIELIRCILHENDSRAFGELMKRYSSHVYGAALRLTKDEENAAEVVQMAFIQAYKQLESWRGENFGAWVTIIANHIALRLLEKEKRHHIDDVTIDDLTICDEGYDEQKEQRLQALEAAVAQLPEGDRLIIQRHYYDGISLAEIAEQIGQTENNVKVRLFRIRERLKKKIEYESND